TDTSVSTRHTLPEDAPPVPDTSGYLGDLDSIPTGDDTPPPEKVFRATITYSNLGRIEIDGGKGWDSFRVTPPSIWSMPVLVGGGSPVGTDGKRDSRTSFGAAAKFSAGLSNGTLRHTGFAEVDYRGLESDPTVTGGSRDQILGPLFFPKTGSLD